MALKHDPPHIRLYDWPNVPKRAREIADDNDVEDIVSVAIVPFACIPSHSVGLIPEFARFVDGDEFYCYLR